MSLSYSLPKHEIQQSRCAAAVGQGGRPARAAASRAGRAVIARDVYNICESNTRKAGGGRQFATLRTRGAALGVVSKRRSKAGMLIFILVVRTPLVRDRSFTRMCQQHVREELLTDTAELLAHTHSRTNTPFKTSKGSLKLGIKSTGASPHRAYTFDIVLSDRELIDGPAYAYIFQNIRKV
ncbi:hypothetical protein EVAR_80393_1 [Eumeta japonica]|uniref:Uncharacterized protein n=1 Tax=Eumeta variegata TaxID=151549 RepID=A0A4C1VHZ3_EUMVA|nr:hypothetical protein EVAR_80393_1 [Eumeta japonica]